MMQRAVWWNVRVWLAAVLLVGVAACSHNAVNAQAQEGGVALSPAAAQEVDDGVGSTPAAKIAAKKHLSAWLMTCRHEAHRQGVSDATWHAAMDGFVPIRKIIQLDRKQPESTKTFSQYLAGTVTASRIAEGKRLYIQHKTIIDFIAAHYHVQPELILALWGMETSYGKITGGFSVPHALATLAYDGRRADFFRDELIKSLLIIEQGHISAKAMKGSWAGAMGQSQFMPSAFLAYAVDADRDGHKDIWNTPYDVFASIANYLHKSGWDGSIGWGMPVELPSGFNPALADIKNFQPMSHWIKLGVRARNGGNLPQDTHVFALIYAGKPQEGAYLISRNYNVILKWNRSRYFATSVGTLADAIAH